VPDQTDSDQPDSGTTTSPDPGAAAPPRRRHPVRARVVTVLACALVLFALIAPNRLEHLTPAGFIRIPVEALLYTVFFLALPVAWARSGRVVAVLAGLGLGLLTILKLLDIGFYATFNRPFDAMLDFPLAGNGLDYLKDTSGQVGAIGAAIGIVVLIVAILVLMALAVRRLTPLLVVRRTTTRRVLAVFTVAWVILAVLGTEIVPHTAVASRSAAAIGISHVIQIPTDIRDAKAFDKEAKVDAFRNVPADQLLTGLRGKDVVVTFIESYGRSAVESPGMAPQVDAVLEAGGARLSAAGFTARSGWLTSPTAGGGSWLAQSTLMSGLWVKNQSLYNKFIASDRMTLNGAFRRADWRTLAVAPGVKKAWPEARVFGFDKIYDAKGLGYKGPRFSWSWMPDQYVLSHFEQTEHSTPDHAPMMVEMPLTSSHMPWTPLPSMVGWDEVGDGSIFKPMAAGKKAGGSMYSDANLVRTRYRKAVEYSLTALTSYLEKYGDDNLVMVFLGDHQPIPLVAGKDASHDVPITVIAKDPAVMDRISGWNWTPGLKPGPKAPVWPMSDFRDKFLTAFGPDGAKGGSATPAPAATSK
jgi:phosphoglycerol transferase MdoB-like AlkP superfamily enzyme